ncbi:hypothetical protein C8R45DRAFT_1213407 [Mycena sanguinolenta]|nr:hypothetical protein C8R45DRAFT_1213407 [Mycena sanguinolenta]
MFKLVFVIALVCSSVLALAAQRAESRSADISAAPQAVPVSAIGNVASVQGANADTRLFFQNGDQSISQSYFGSSILLVPGNEVLSGTPIAAATVNGTALEEIHVFFLSPASILSEYIWTNDIGWHGGTSCTTCITVNKFVVQRGSKILYAMGNDVAGSTRLRVGRKDGGLRFVDRPEE